MKTMRQKVILRKRTTPKTLPNGTTFIARYERIGRKQLPINIRVRNARIIGPRNRNKITTGPRRTKKATVSKKKKGRFTPSTSLRERLARIKRYRASRQSGSGLASS